MTDRGLRPIEQIEVGDLVLSRDEDTGETAYKPVTQLIRNGESEIWELKLRIEGDSSDSTFQTTEEHPWRTIEAGWLGTSTLVPGMRIVRAEGRPAIVVSVSRTKRKAPTFNLEVADFHTYFVGAEGAWVHNTCNAEKAAEIIERLRSARPDLCTNLQCVDFANAAEEALRKP